MVRPWWWFGIAVLAVKVFAEHRVREPTARRPQQLALTARAAPLAAPPGPRRAAATPLAGPRRRGAQPPPTHPRARPCHPCAADRRTELMLTTVSARRAARAARRPSSVRGTGRRTEGKRQSPLPGRARPGALTSRPRRPTAQRPTAAHAPAAVTKPVPQAGAQPVVARAWPTPAPAHGAR